MNVPRVFKNKTDLINSLITDADTVLDVGFWGQGVNPTHSNWVHNVLRKRARDVYGVDLDFDEKGLSLADHYSKQSAEDFSFDRKFDVIFAGDLIEHLPNPGKFLDASKRNLAPAGKLIISTPNAFNLYSIAEKLSKEEPTVNPDHTCYFNSKTLVQLFSKCGWNVDEVHYVYSLEHGFEESWKKHVLNALYAIAARFTDKFLETIVIVATPKA